MLFYFSLHGGMIRDSNRPSLLTLLRGWNLCAEVVDLEASAIDSELAAKRLAIHDRQFQGESASSPAGKIASDKDIAFNNDAIVADYKEKLAALKGSVFGPLVGIGVKVVRDYPHSAASLVTVPDLQALQSLLKNASVVRISVDQVVKIAATWPGL